MRKTFEVGLEAGGFQGFSSSFDVLERCLNPLQTHLQLPSSSPPFLSLALTRSPSVLEIANFDLDHNSANEQLGEQVSKLLNLL